MDKTLMRPLFRQKAEEILQPKKIDGTQVPKYAIGGLIPLAQAGMRLAAPTFKFLGKVGRQATKKAPGITGAAELGISAPFVAEGAGDVYEGITSGDYGQVATGLGEFGLGLLGGGRGLRTAAISKKVPANLKQPMKDVGKGIESFLPKGTGYASLGLMGTGAVFEDDEEAPKTKQQQAAEYQKDIQDRLIYTKPEYADSVGLESDLTQDVLIKPKVAIGLKDPKNEAEKRYDVNLKKLAKLNEVVQKFNVEKLSDLTDAQLKQLAIESNISEREVRAAAGKNPTKTIAAPAPTSGSNSAINSNNANAKNIQDGQYTEGNLEALKKERQTELQNAKSAVEDPLSSGFKQFRDKLNKMTGSDNDNLNNLIMMKAASTYLSGKTKERGTRGFLDITGQAMGDAANMMFQLALSQKNQDMELAKAYLSMQAKKSGQDTFKKGKDVLVELPDPNALGGVINKSFKEGEDGKLYERVTAPDGSQTFAEADIKKFPGARIRDVDNKTIATTSLDLFENKRGQDMVNFVIENAEKYAGANAKIDLFVEDIFGTFEALSAKAGGLGNVSSNVDGIIKTRLATDRTGGPRDMFGISSEKGAYFDVFKKEADRISERYDSDINSVLEERTINGIKTTKGAEDVYNQLKKEKMIGASFRPNEEDLRKYTKLALIEQRMKYLVANSNKKQDRLTQKDIDNAESLTKIIKFFGSPRTIKNNYMQLRQEFMNKAERDLSQYKIAGGPDSYIANNFFDVPGIQELYTKGYKEQAKKEFLSKKENVNKILGTIGDKAIIGKQ